MDENISLKWEEICKCIKEFDDVYHKIATYFNLSDSSFLILYDLYNNEYGRTQKELCDDWYVSKQTIDFRYEGDNRKNISYR